MRQQDRGPDHVALPLRLIAHQRPKRAGVRAGHHDKVEALTVLVVVALDQRILDRAAPPVDLAVGRRTIELGQALLDIVLAAGAIEHVPR